MEKTEDTRAKDQARAQLDSITEMVKRFEHCQECDGTDCSLTDKEILEGINIHYQDGMAASEEDRTQYHDEDEAREAISEDPLSVEVRSDWHEPGSKDDKPTEYKILLCTGGPAVRIIGELDEYGQPETAKIEYQDWFTPWVSYANTSSEEDETLLTYARQFYYGE